MVKCINTSTVLFSILIKDQSLFVALLFSSIKLDTYLLKQNDTLVEKVFLDLGMWTNHVGRWLSVHV